MSLIKIKYDDCLLDVDGDAWDEIVQMRGGCNCCVSPPCAACSSPIEEWELNAVGYTYGEGAEENGKGGTA